MVSKYSNFIELIYLKQYLTEKLKIFGSCGKICEKIDFWTVFYELVENGNFSNFEIYAKSFTKASFIDAANLKSIRRKEILVASTRQVADA